MISAADYVIEPPDLWTSRLPSRRWGEAIPHVAMQGDGVERWVIGGKVQCDTPLAQVGALLKERFAEPRSWREVPAAAHTTNARLEAMDAPAGEDAGGKDREKQ